MRPANAVLQTLQPARFGRAAMRVLTTVFVTLFLLIGEVICSDGDGSAGHDAQCKPDAADRCFSVLGKCEVKGGSSQCSCPEAFNWDDQEKACFLEQAYWYTVSFKTVGTKETQDGVEDCTEENNIVEPAMKQLYGDTLVTAKLLKCSDQYNVELKFNTLPEQNLLEEIRACDYQKEEGACDFPPNLRVVNGSVSEVTEMNLCDTYLKDVAPKFGKQYECTKRNNESSYALTCKKSHRGMAMYTQGALQVDICAERKCEEYCTETERQCLEGKCVCHLNYIESSEGVCTPICDKNPCKNRGTCERSEKISYYCRCQPGYTGPNCEVQFEEYKVAQRNITIVGVVLGVFIIICLGISGAVIRRLKNKTMANEQL
ncbi:glycoprotein antigen BM86 [Rhipicephalus sanguineus]|uniref:glycoprotein antigen BM86 n=1 Tax=Rhipicephalus sanguineus TaxID=34632 RepID=UPI00189493D1|nr:glycoprotein antigen BM86 [Rhipicephalus sanguineus]XP_049272211.1 glycoprotein antigen BM86 [Rhipicephalus sanguineus]